MDNSFDMYNKKLKKEKKDDDNKSTLSKFLFTILITFAGLVGVIFNVVIILKFSSVVILL